MSVTTAVSPDGGTVTISIAGRFDFQLHQVLRNAYEPHLTRKPGFVIDLTQTEYLDSSALGMLIILRKQAGGDHARVAIRGARDGVRKTLEVANFGKLFSLS
ncbi:MAG: STAS domain-containing protein [Planctomycetes bacterium]|nr:STAS domain-containing protein [Planctomycetota bacterium]